VQDQFKPLRSQLGRQQWKETKDFEAKERRVAGKLENALAAIRHAKDFGRDTSKGFASMAFNFLTSKKARADALKQRHGAQWRNLRSAEKTQIDAAVSKLRSDQQASLAKFRTNFGNRRQTLKDAQDAERATLQRKWATRKLERQRAFALVKEAKRIKREAKAEPELTRGQARTKFNQAAKGERKRRSRSRTRNPKDSE
jgi:hypothetical protein